MGSKSAHSNTIWQSNVRTLRALPSMLKVVMKSTILLFVLLDDAHKTGESSLFIKSTVRVPLYTEKKDESASGRDEKTRRRTRSERRQRGGLPARHTTDKEK